MPYFGRFREDQNLQKNRDILYIGEKQIRFFSKRQMSTIFYLRNIFFSIFTIVVKRPFGVNWPKSCKFLNLVRSFENDIFFAFFDGSRLNVRWTHKNHFWVFKNLPIEFYGKFYARKWGLYILGM